MLRPFRRVGRVALRRSLPRQTWRFPRIDSRSIEASSAPTRGGAACARGCRLNAGTPLVLLAYSVQWPRGEFKETLGDRSRRRVTDSSAQLHSREYLPAFRFNERVRPKEVRTPDPNGHFELGGTLATRGRVRQACRVRNGRLLRLHNINQTGGSL